MPAFIPALAAGAKAVAGAVATQAGRQAAVQGAKQAAEKVGKVAVQAGNTKAGQALTAGQIASSVGEQAANRQQMQQQNMMNQNQQMAQAAKAGSEIRTGEPMDILWDLMKAWKWDSRWDERQIDNIKAQLRRGNKHTIGLADRGHYTKNAEKRIEPNQKMPRGFESNTHEQVALAIAEILLEKNPELKEHLNTKVRTKQGGETYEEYPVLRIPGLSTDKPKQGIEKPHYVIGHKTARAEDGGSGIGLITVGAEHHSGHRQAKEWHPIRDSEYEFVSAPKFMESKGPSAQEINQRAIERVAEGGRISRDDVSSSANLTNIFNPRNIYRQGANRMMQNFAGRMDFDPETGAPRSTYLQAQHPLQQNLLNIRAKNNTVNPLNVDTEPTKVDRNDPQVQMMLSSGVYVIETDEHGNEKLVMKSEPMDLAFRLLKREVHPGRSIEDYLEAEENYDMNNPNIRHFLSRLHLDKQPAHQLLPMTFGMNDLGYVEPELRVENKDTRIYHPMTADEHENFPDRKIVERDGRKEELVSTSGDSIVYEPVVNEADGTAILERKPTFQDIPFNYETGFTRSEPMDLAWHMLKGELQLPNEISDDMRRDLAVLDRNHTFEETSDGTMVGNIHPDMEHVVKLLTGMQEDVDDIAKPTYTPPQFYY